MNEFGAGLITPSLVWYFGVVLLVLFVRVLVLVVVVGVGLFVRGLVLVVVLWVPCSSGLFLRLSCVSFFVVVGSSSGLSSSGSS